MKVALIVLVECDNIVSTLNLLQTAWNLHLFSLTSLCLLLIQVLSYISGPTTDTKLGEMNFSDNLHSGVIWGADQEYRSHFALSTSSILSILIDFINPLFSTWNLAFRISSRFDYGERTAIKCRFYFEISRTLEPLALKGRIQSTPIKTMLSGGFVFIFVISSASKFSIDLRENLNMENSIN